MEKFEYYTYVYDTVGIMGGKVDIEDFSGEMNSLGLEGWELVSSVATHQGSATTRSIVSIFKRKIQ